jgi:hypothetical protein
MNNPQSGRGSSEGEGMTKLEERLAELERVQQMICQVMNFQARAQGLPPPFLNVPPLQLPGAKS